MKPTWKPRIALLIPAYNEALHIYSTVWSARHAGFSANDIYVINDGSTDGTAMEARITGCYVLTVKRGGKAGAIEAGLKAFDILNRYQYVGILDADSQLHPSYLGAMRRAIERYPGASLLCGGPVSWKSSWLTAFRAMEYAICLGVYRTAQSATGTINVAPGCASLYATEALRLLDISGGTLTEDMDLTIQLQRMGREVRFVEDAKVYTQDPRDLKGYIGQVARWYRGHWQCVRKHRMMRQVSAIDAEMALITLEALVFSPLIVLLPLWAYLWPWYTFIGLVADQMLSFTFASLAARQQKRWDIVRYFPLFWIPRYLNACIFVWAFLKERKVSTLTPSSWFTVERY